MQTEKEKILSELLKLTEDAIRSWSFLPDQYGSEEALIPSSIMIKLSELFEKYCEIK
jgi:hypothetical protein